MNTNRKRRPYASQSYGFCTPILRWPILESGRFVLNGDGATPLPSVVSWGEVTLLLGVLSAGALLGGIWIFLRQRGRIDRQDDARAVIR